MHIHAYIFIFYIDRKREGREREREREREKDRQRERDICLKEQMLIIFLILISKEINNKKDYITFIMIDYQ